MLFGIDFKARGKNHMTYIGIIGIVFASAGISFETLTSWSLLFDAILSILNNPVAIVAVVMAVLGVFTDTSTKGIADCTREHVGEEVHG